jgi:AraC-like DNA-binding protein
MKKGTGIIEYFKYLKIERAKTLIREENHNITEIAEILDYNSIHSFSRHFKKATDISPSEYAKSIKSRI